MAKDLGLALQAIEQTGTDARMGRLAQQLYAAFAATAPAVGSAVSTEEGEGVVVGHSVPADAVLVRMTDSGQVSSCSRACVCGSRQVFATRTTTLEPGEDPAGPDAPAARPSTGKPRTRRRRPGPPA